MAKVVHLGAPTIENRALSAEGTHERVVKAIGELAAALAAEEHANGLLADALNGNARLGLERVEPRPRTNEEILAALGRA